MFRLVADQVLISYEAGYQQAIKDVDSSARGKARSEVLPITARATLYAKDQGWMQ